jgi:hypothetical protein
MDKDNDAAKPQSEEVVGKGREEFEEEFEDDEDEDSDDEEAEDGER